MGLRTSNAITLIMNMLKKQAHPNAQKWLQDDFYWSENDPTCPFGSFEGNKALEAYKAWKEDHPKETILLFLSGFLQKLAKIPLLDYTSDLVDRYSIEEQILNRKFDDYKNIFAVDVSLIAVGLGSFIVDGKIEAELFPILYTAIDRLMLWNELQPDFDKTCENHIINLYNMRNLLEKLAHI